MLTGTVPPDWALPSQLYNLDLCSCMLSGPLPVLALPDSLANADYSDNFFTGTLPPLLLPERLEWFGAAMNKLTGTLPSVWNLPNTLTELDLYDNFLEGAVGGVAELCCGS